MTDQEKSDHPSYETTGGYLKKRDISKAYQEWWDRLSGDQKQIIREIPNFDAKKFGMITGINTIEAFSESESWDIVDEAIEYMKGNL